jgi:hypothetical protein
MVIAAPPSLGFGIKCELRSFGMSRSSRFNEKRRMAPVRKNDMQHASRKNSRSAIAIRPGCNSIHTVIVES